MYFKCSINRGIPESLCRVTGLYKVNKKSKGVNV